jgi:Beta-propeller repeat
LEDQKVEGDDCFLVLLLLPGGIKMKHFNLTTLLCLAAFLAACAQDPARQETLLSQDFGTPSQEFANDVVATSTGVYTVGYTDGSLDGPSKGLTDAFLRKYDGGVVWAQQFGSRSVDYAGDIAVDSAGNSYTLGDTSGALGLKIGSYDSFLRKYDTNGVLKWTRQFGTTGFDSSRDVIIDSSSNLYTLSVEASKAVIRKWSSSGSLLLTITTPAFTGDPKALARDSTGNLYIVAAVFSTNNDVKLYKYTSSGAAVAGFPKNIYATANSDYPYDMKIDSTNSIYVTLIEDNLAGTTTAYLRKLDSNGTALWTKNLQPTAVTGFTAPSALAIDASNNIYVGGATSGAYTGFTNAGFADLFALKYNTSGTRLWTRQFGANDDDLGLGIAASSTGVYLVGGSYSDPNLLGDPGYGSADAFLAQLNPATGVVVAIDQ